MKGEKSIHILIPTYNRLSSLAVTLTSLYYQTEKDFDIIIADQSSEYDVASDPLIQTIVRLFETTGHKIAILKNLPQRGMAQQRQFLLEHSNAAYSLFLDDDVILEPYVVRNLKYVLTQQQCGFAGCAVIGLSFRNDVRPHQQSIELWENSVQPEAIVPKGKEWQRYQLHNAANVYHVQQKICASPDDPKPYKVAWIGGCILYDTQKLLSVGGFAFWKDLPEKHCGEDVLAQLRVMKRYGGCGILPSGVYHQELPTTVTDRKINAPEFLEI
jgi:GT2 family glycosyltransferase